MATFSAAAAEATTLAKGAVAVSVILTKRLPPRPFPVTSRTAVLQLIPVIRRRATDGMGMEVEARIRSPVDGPFRRYDFSHATFIMLLWLLTAILLPHSPVFRLTETASRRRAQLLYVTCCMSPVPQCHRVVEKKRESRSSKNVESPSSAHI
jgi:hypothetical protein